MGEEKDKPLITKIIAILVIMIFMFDWLFVNHVEFKEGVMIFKIDPNFKAVLNVTFSQALLGLLAYIGFKIKGKNDKNNEGQNND